MGKWKYEGIDGSGQKVQGAIDASNEKEVRRNLRSKGVRVRRISAPSILDFDITEWMIEAGLSKPFGKAELATFTKQLSIMINAGVPIIQALEILHKSQSHLVLKRIIKKIAIDVSEGKTISEAMSKHQGFDPLYCNLVKAGEAGGILDTILDKLSIHMEKQEKTKKQIKSAMTYPFIVTLVGIGVIWGMMVFVVPQFVDMLKDTGQEPPFITQLVMDTSKFLGDHSMNALPFILLAGFLFTRLIKTKNGKLMFDRVTMHMPIFGGIIIKGNLGNFSRTLSTMLGSGVTLIDALEICIDTIDNVVIKNDLVIVKNKIIEGKTLADPLEKITYFPTMVASMIKVGEQTGNIDDMLEKVANVFEEEVNYLVSNMTKMIEPIIIVVLGGLIAAILVAMYLPMFMSAGGSSD